MTLCVKSVRTLRKTLTTRHGVEYFLQSMPRLVATLVTALLGPLQQYHVVLGPPGQVDPPPTRVHVHFPHDGALSVSGTLASSHLSVTPAIGLPSTCALFFAVRRCHSASFTRAQAPPPPVCMNRVVMFAELGVG